MSPIKMNKLLIKKGVNAKIRCPIISRQKLMRIQDSKISKKHYV